jgi:dCTP deaminase
VIINGQSLFNMKPVDPMLNHKVKHNGVSHGLAEVGYDIRIKQDVTFEKRQYPSGVHWQCIVDHFIEGEKFCLASTIERFQMPPNLVGIVHDKSTWARKGLSVFNTVVEPSWCGFLTLELVYHGNEDLHIPAGSGIAQVIFHQILHEAEYSGKYQGQEDKPVAAIMEG